MTRASLRDVLGALTENAREALLARNPHLKDEWSLAQREASGCDARVVVEGRSIVVTLDGMRLVSEANLRESWEDRYRRSKRQKRAVAGALSNTAPPEGQRYTVTITRLAARGLDTDNLAGSGKHVRDAIAAWLGLDDGPSAPIEWRVTQRKAKTYGVVVRIDGFDAETIGL